MFITFCTHMSCIAHNAPESKRPTDIRVSVCVWLCESVNTAQTNRTEPPNSTKSLPKPLNFHGRARSRVARLGVNTNITHDESGWITVTNSNQHQKPSRSPFLHPCDLLLFCIQLHMRCAHLNTKTCDTHTKNTEHLCVPFICRCTCVAAAAAACALRVLHAGACVSAYCACVCICIAPEIMGHIECSRAMHQCGGALVVRSCVRVHTIWLFRRNVRVFLCFFFSCFFCK